MVVNSPASTIAVAQAKHIAHLLEVEASRWGRGYYKLYGDTNTPSELFYRKLADEVNNFAEGLEMPDE